MRNDKVWLRVRELGGWFAFFWFGAGSYGDETYAGYWKQVQIQEGI